MEKLTRIYKYALDPTEQQIIQLNSCMSTSRFLWNRLVRLTKYTLKEMSFGRRATIENEYIDLLTNKELTGMRVKSVNDLANSKNISKEEALELFILEKSKKDIQIKYRKNGERAILWSNRHLAW